MITQKNVEKKPSRAYLTELSIPCNKLGYLK